MSHVSYATGAVLPVADVCRLARERGILVLVDGAQGAGHLPLNVSELGCDFYALPGQKWLLGPEGTGALYVREEVIEQVQPTRIGWASLSSEDFTSKTYIFQADARRFEAGTIHSPAFGSLASSIEILSGIGWERIFEHSRRLARKARQGLEEMGAAVFTPAHADSGLLTFGFDGVDPEKLVSVLWAKYRIVVRSISHPSGIRAAFHAFNDDRDVDGLLAALRNEK